MVAPIPAQMVLDSCKCLESTPGLLEEQPALIMAEPSLQLTSFSCYSKIYLIFVIIITIIGVVAIVLTVCVHMSSEDNSEEFLFFNHVIQGGQGLDSGHLVCTRSSLTHRAIWKAPWFFFLCCQGKTFNS